MESPCSNFSENNFTYRGTPNIYSLKTGSQEHRDRCNAAPSVQRVWLCISSIQSDQPCFEENPAREGRLFDHSEANMANPVLLFSAFNVVHTETITVSAHKKYVAEPTRPTTFFQERP